MIMIMIFLHMERQLRETVLIRSFIATRRGTSSPYLWMSGIRRRELPKGVFLQIVLDRA